MSILGKKTSGFLKWVDGQLQEAQVAQQRDEGVHRGSEQEVADDLFSQAISWASVY